MSAAARYLETLERGPRMPISEDMAEPFRIIGILVVSVSNLAACHIDDDTALYPQPKSLGR
jgi:hypothetical protein